MSQDCPRMDHSSSAKQIAEEINGFSALSGTVTVETKGTSAYNGRSHLMLQMVTLHSLWLTQMELMLWLPERMDGH